MPELPEVEVTRLGISPHITGKAVDRLILRRDKLRWPIPPQLGECLPHSTIEEVSRRGKYLLLRTKRGCAMFHLGMSGSLRILPRDTPAQKHDHVDIVFDDCLLRLNDPRRFGALLWQAPQQEHPLLSKLGVEPLGNDFDGEMLWQAARRKSIAIKSFIMDSHIVVGVGNIYACEALFLAGIHPKRATNKVSRARMQALAEAIKSVLTQAIAAGGTTLKDFTRSDGKPGYFKQNLQVYGRGGKTCLICDKALKMIVIQGRSTVFCSHCQR